MSDYLEYVLLNEYFPARLSIRAEDTKRQYLYAVAGLSRSILRPATIDDLTDDNVTRYMRRMLDDGLSPFTINERRGRLTALWNWLARRGRIGRWPTVQRIPEAEPIPRAWRRNELDALFAACRLFPGVYCGVPAGPWWLAFHCVLWDTGERKGAVMALRWDWVDLVTGDVIVPAKARKGGRKSMCYCLKPATLETLQAIANPKRDLVFPYDRCEARWYSQYTALLKLAGLPADRTCKAQRMRVSFATWVHVLGGNATEALSHSTPHVTIRHYLDPTLTREQPNKLLWRIDDPEGRHGERKPLQPQPLE